MSCDKINPAVVSLNGASSAYGGSISNLTLNFGTLAEGINATVTLVGGSLTNPTPADGFTVGIMGMKLNMDVAGYGFTSSAAGMSTLRLTLKDKSHSFLDHDFVVRKDEVVGGIAGLNYLGKKYGPAPNNVASDLGFLVPSSSTQWVDIRAFFETLQTAYNLYRSPFATWLGAAEMTDEQVDDHCLTTNGKSIWQGEELKALLGDDDPDYPDITGLGILSGSGGVDACEEDDDEDCEEESEFPSGEFQFDGSLREVVMGVCNAVGWVPYWDAQTDKLVVVPSISSAAGNDILDDIDEKCTLVGSASSSDFTTSLSVGAIGGWSSTSSANQGQEGQGGKVARFYRASLINPTFYYAGCAKDTNKDGEATEAKKLYEINTGSTDVQKAMYASYDANIYAMYVLQTVLASRHAMGWDADTLANPIKAAVTMAGRDPNKVEIDMNWKAHIIIDPCSTYTINEVFKNHYCAEGEDDDCAGQVYGIYFEEGSTPEKHMVAKADGDWNKPAQKESAPQNHGGLFDGLFAKGYHVIRRRDFIKDEGGPDEELIRAFPAIFAENGLTGEEDAMRLYLKSIHGFYNRFYVIKESSGLRSATDIDGNSYGFYITQDSQGPGLAPVDDSGFRACPANPYINMWDCAITELKDLFIACSLIHTNECSVDVMEATSLVVWMRVLNGNVIKEFFANPPFYQVSRGCYSAASVEGNSNSQPMMHIYVKGASPNPEPSKGGENVTCLGTTTDSSDVEKIAQGMDSFALAETDGEGTLGLFDKIYQSWIVTATDIHSELDSLTVTSPSKLSLRAWFDTAGSMGTLTGGPGPQYLSHAVMPAGGSWSSKLNRSISVDAADLSRGGSSTADYLAAPLTEGSQYLPSQLGTMQTNLTAKVAAHAWTDSTSAARRTSTIVLGEDFADIDLPGIDEGLEALSITNQNGKLEVSITVGNSFERAAKRAMFELMASNTNLQHVALTNIPDTFIGGASPKLVQISKGMI